MSSCPTFIIINMCLNYSKLTLTLSMLVLAAPSDLILSICRHLGLPSWKEVAMVETPEATGVSDS